MTNFSWFYKMNSFGIYRAVYTGILDGVSLINRYRH
jgi:hypothetical protein